MNFPKAEFGALGLQPYADVCGVTAEGGRRVLAQQRKPGLFARIIALKGCGVYSEVTVMNRDGIATSFENTEECGLKHREPDWVHSGLVTPVRLVEKVLHHGQRNDAQELHLVDGVTAYEQSVNENLAWRQSVGIRADEARQAPRVRGKRRSIEA